MIDNIGKVHKLLTFTDKTVFSVQDLALIWEYTDYSSLKELVRYYVKSGKLKKISRGLYFVTGRDYNSYELGNKLRSPSYISFETVLAKEGVIFQWYDKITLAAKESISIDVEKEIFEFRQLKNEILFNSDGVVKEGNYYIATKERALLDMLYINPKFMFDNLNSVDFELCNELLPVYSRKSLSKLIEKMKKDVRSE